MLLGITDPKSDKICIDYRFPDLNSDKICIDYKFSDLKSDKTCVDYSVFRSEVGQNMYRL